MGKSSGHPLYVALLWHLHQPFYKDLATGEYWLPWARLHAIKDYYHMASILTSFPDLRLNFNIVPSLLEQLEDYAKKGVKERSLDLSRTPSKDLNSSDKANLLRDFFSANWETMIDPHPRYRELLEKRGRGGDEEKWAKIQRHFSTQDFLDLQVWFNLAWFSSVLKEADPFIHYLVQKGRSYSEEEKLQLLEKQVQIISQVIPLYQRLFDEGQIEITTSPYYHPILPLLCDSHVAREPSPDISLPKYRFRHPEDALAQINKAQDAFFKYFNKPVQGMWPPEGSVSQEMALLSARAGIRWIASDEEILYRSLGLTFPGDSHKCFDKPKLLYQPYSFRNADLSIDLLFRDHVLSDLIGFTYARWEAKEAAGDLLGRLQRIRRDLESFQDDGPFVVTIILDGENAWEHYKKDGRDFLLFLYEGLDRKEGLQTTRISDFLQRYPPRNEILSLAAGSWINHDFRIWIGHEEDNAAWDLLTQTRDDLLALEATPERGLAARGEESVDFKRAWEELYIAEGSDWCWWYGDDHSSGIDDEFDDLFRKHLMNVYHFIKAEIPARLYVPILRARKKENLSLTSVDLIHPSIDGKLTTYFEWLPAASYEFRRRGNTMHHPNAIFSAIYVGFDYDRMFLRFDFEEDSLRRGERGRTSGVFVHIRFLAPSFIRAEVRLDVGAPRPAVRLYEDEGGSALNIDSREEFSAEGLEAAIGDIVEMAIPFRALRAEAGKDIQFIVFLWQNGAVEERWPPSGYFTVNVPSGEFESEFWQL